MHTRFYPRSFAISPYGGFYGNQNGIQIGPGATGDLKRNTIIGHLHNGAGLVAASYGLIAFDHDAFNRGTPPLSLLPIRCEGNIFRDNQVHIASIQAHGSQFVNNTFQGTGIGVRAFAIGLSGKTNLVSGNHFSDLPVGILLFGNDPDFGTYLGLTADAQLINNRFCDVATPIDIESLVTGTTNQGTLLCPFPPPTLAIAPAVLLTWPAVEPGSVVQCATNAAGPWVSLGIAPTVTGNVASVTVKTIDAAKFFRLRSP